jgi:hypothetical protein
MKKNAIFKFKIWKKIKQSIEELNSKSILLGLLIAFQGSFLIYRILKLMVNNSTAPKYADGGFYLDTTANIVGFFKGDLTWTYVTNYGSERTMVFQFPVALISWVLNLTTKDGFYWIHCIFYGSIFIFSCLKILYIGIKKWGLTLLIAPTFIFGPSFLWLNASEYWSGFASISLLTFSIFSLLKWLNDSRNNWTLFAFIACFGLSVFVHWASTIFMGSIVVLVSVVIFGKSPNYILSQLRNKRSLYQIVISFLFLAGVFVLFRIIETVKYTIVLIANWDSNWFSEGAGGIRNDLDNPKLFYFFQALRSLFNQYWPFWISLLFLAFFSSKIRGKRILISISILILSQIIWLSNDGSSRYFFPIAILVMLVFTYISKVETRQVIYSILLCNSLLVAAQLNIFSHQTTKTFNFFSSILENEFLSSFDAKKLNDIYVSDFFRTESKKFNERFKPVFDYISDGQMKKKSISVIDPENATGWGGFEGGLHYLNYTRFTPKNGYKSAYELGTRISGRWPGEGNAYRVMEEVTQQNVNALMESDFVVYPARIEKYSDKKWPLDRLFTRTDFNDYTNKILEIDKSHQYQRTIFARIINKNDFRKYIEQQLCSMEKLDVGLISLIEHCDKNSYVLSKIKLNLIPDSLKSFNVKNVESYKVEGEIAIKVTTYIPIEAGDIHVHFVPKNGESWIHCPFVHHDRVAPKGKEIWISKNSTALNSKCTYVVRLVP